MLRSLSIAKPGKVRDDEFTAPKTEQHKKAPGE